MPATAATGEGPPSFLVVASSDANEAAVAAAAEAARVTIPPSATLQLPPPPPQPAPSTPSASSSRSSDSPFASVTAAPAAAAAAASTASRLLAVPGVVVGAPSRHGSFNSATTADSSSTLLGPPPPPPPSSGRSTPSKSPSSPTAPTFLHSQHQSSSSSLFPIAPAADPRMAAAMMHYSRSSSFASSRRSSYIEAAAAADTTTTTPAHLSSSADNLPSPAAAATAATIAAAAAAAAGDHSHNNSSLGTAAFGLTPLEITAAVDARDTALLEERWGGVVGVAMRLRTDPERGLSEAMEPATLDGVGAPWWAAAAAMAARARGGGGGGRSALSHHHHFSNSSSSSSSSQQPLSQAGERRPSSLTLGAGEPAKSSNNTYNDDDNRHYAKNGAVPADSTVATAADPDTDAEMGRAPAAATDSFLVRKSVFGENKLAQPHTKSVWEFAFEALKDKTLIVLCVAAFVDLAIGIYKSGFAEQREPAAYVDGIAILFAVVVIVLISALNDYRKQSQFRQLSDYSRSLSKFHVIRDGKTREMPTASILVGDICQISAGDILPSDGIVIQSFNLSCDESALTGESMAVSKSPTTDPFVLSGTKVVDGIGKIVIVATGPNSVNGRLLASLEVEVEETPLQAKLGKLADAISLFGLGAALVMVLGLVILYFSIAPAVPRTTVDIVNDLVNLFIIGVTIVVVAVPEGLPLAVVLALAHATLRMLKDNNLVRHLKACETMGNATTVCSDKTGTLTQNRMTVVAGTFATHQFGSLKSASSSVVIPSPPPSPITPTITLSSSSPTPQRTLGRGSSSRVTLSSDFDHHNELNDTNLLVPGRPIGSATHLLVPGAGSSRRSRDDASSISYTPSLNAPPTPTNAGTPTTQVAPEAVFAASSDPVKLANGSGGAPDFIAGTRLPEVVVNHVARCINLNTTAEEVAAPPLADDEGSSDGEDDVGAGGSVRRGGWLARVSASLRAGLLRRRRRGSSDSANGAASASPSPTSRRNSLRESLDSRSTSVTRNNSTSTTAALSPPAESSSSSARFVGSKTEVALLEFTDKRLRRNYKPDRERSEVVMVLPFSSERKRMSTIIKVPSRERDGKLEQALFGASHDPTLGTVGGKRWSRGEKYWLFCKGAAEIVLQSCDRYLNDEGKAMPITPEIRAELEALIEGMASSALRTICVAFKPFRGSVAKLAGEDPAKSEPTLIPPPLASPPTITISTSADGDSKPPPLTIAIDTSAATLDHPGNGGYSSDDTDATEGEPTDPDAHGLILASVLGIEDPLRPEVPAAIADCARAGIVVRMVTGDNMATARSIARQAGILPASSSAGGSSTAYPQVMEGPAFRALSPEEQDEVVPHLRVLARSSPQDKQVLVQRLKKLGETVAVTGDGTNDAPALRMADVGFSMGIAGTEVAKEASDIILLDDNFVSLSKAIVWGRSVYDSVRKFLQFQLTVNVVAVLLAMVTAFLTATLTPTKVPESVLSTVQLLWVNLIMDTFAALALATDRPTPDLLDRPPSRRSDPLISRDMLLMILGQSLYQLVACLTLYCGYSGIMRDRRINYDDLFDGVDPVTETVVFNTFVFCQVFNEINCRVIGSKLNVFKGITQNSYFVGIFVMTVVVQIVIVQAGGVAFKTTPLEVREWAICLAVGALSLPIGAGIRLLARAVYGDSAAAARGFHPETLGESADSAADGGFLVGGVDGDADAGGKGKGMAGATYLALPPPPVVIVSRPSMSE